MSDRSSEPTARSSRSGNAVPEPTVTNLFDSIAPVYDRMNTLMTAGMDGRWRRAAVRASRLRPGNSALDVACGTGKLTREMAVVVGERGRVVGVDISAAMLDQARKELSDVPWIELRQGNALELPVEDGTFDAVTIAFGMRNLADYEAGFRELARAVKPGGRVVCLELSVPRSPRAGRLYTLLFRMSAPAMGMLFGQRSAYSYLPQSLEGFPGAERMAAIMRDAGLRDVRFKRLALGLVAIHVGIAA